MGDATANTSATATTTTASGCNGVKRLRSPTKIKHAEVAPWIFDMINILEYKDCPVHSRTNRFCIKCVRSFCNECSSDHDGHNQIQIRRYIYNNVIKLPDFKKHFDCSGIQSYKTNHIKVIHLRKRSDNQQGKEQQNNAGDVNCVVCNHKIMDATYCSIQCKIIAVCKTGSTEWDTDDNNLKSTEGATDDNNVNDTEGVTDDDDVKNTEGATDDNDVSNIEEAKDDNNASKNTREESENGLCNGIIFHCMSKRSRKGIPLRAPLF